MHDPWLKYNTNGEEDLILVEAEEILDTLWQSGRHTVKLQYVYWYDFFYFRSIQHLFRIYVTFNTQHKHAAISFDITAVWLVTSNRFHAII